MKASELKKLLAAKGCRFETHRGGSGHLTVISRRQENAIADARTEGTRHRAGEQDTQGSRSQVMLAYLIKLTRDDNGTFLVTCPALPEVTTFGETEDEVQHAAIGAIEEAIAARISYGERLPPPVPAAENTPGRNTRFVKLPTMTALKTQLYIILRESGTTRAELSRRLGWHREQVDRLFRLDHASRLDRMEAAFRALEREIEVDIREEIPRRPERQSVPSKRPGRAAGNNRR
jgi:antitoxin HicB